MSEKRLSGSCLCGNITYTSTSPSEHLDYCYCLICQKVSGAPFMAWTGIPKASMQWKFQREPFKWRAPVGDTSISVSERTCCGNCGCNIMLQYDLYPDKTHVAASTIQQNDFPMPAVGCHIWCKHVPEWHMMADDGVPRYEEFDEEFRARLDAHLQEKV